MPVMFHVLSDGIARELLCGFEIEGISVPDSQFCIIQATCVQSEYKVDMSVFS